MRLADFLSDFDRDRVLATRERIAYSRIDSTNRVGRRLAVSRLENGVGPSTVLLTALEQTSGRGRLGRRWLSPPGGIYASLVVGQASVEQLALFPMRTAVALCGEIDRVVDSCCRLKWPNDLVVDGRKIGGILIESVGRDSQRVAIIGFGVNYGPAPRQLATQSTSVIEESTSAPSLPRLATLLVAALERELARTDTAPQVAERFARWSVHRPGEPLRCRVAGDIWNGTFGGFDKRGFLRLVTSDGVRSISAGEVIEVVGEGPI